MKNLQRLERTLLLQRHSRPQTLRSLDRALSVMYKREEFWGRECSNVSLLAGYVVWKSGMNLHVTCMTLHKNEYGINRTATALDSKQHVIQTGILHE